METNISVYNKHKRKRLRATAIILIMVIVTLTALTMPAYAVVTETAVALWVLGSLATMVGIKVLPTAITSIESAFTKIYTWLNSNNPDGVLTARIDAEKLGVYAAFNGGANSATINVPASELPAIQAEILDALGADGEALAAEIAAKESGDINLATYDIDVSGWTLTDSSYITTEQLMSKEINNNDILFNNDKNNKYVLYLNTPSVLGNKSISVADTRLDYIIFESIGDEYGYNAGVKVTFSNTDKTVNKTAERVANIAPYRNETIKIYLGKSTTDILTAGRIVNLGIWQNNNYYIGDNYRLQKVMITDGNTIDVLGETFGSISGLVINAFFDINVSYTLEKYEMQESTPIGAKTISGVIPSLQSSAATGDGTVSLTLAPNLNQKLYLDGETKSALDTALGRDINDVTTNTYDLTNEAELTDEGVIEDGGTNPQLPNGNFWNLLGKLIIAPIRIIIAIMALLGRILVYIGQLLTVQPYSEGINENIITGFEYMKGVKVFNTLTIWDITQILITFMYGLVTAMIAKKYVLKGH